MHKITKDEFIRLNNLMMLLVGKEGHNHPPERITELFNIHNLCYPQKLEYSKSCGSCRQRVYNRVLEYWSGMKGEYGF